MMFVWTIGDVLRVTGFGLLAVGWVGLLAYGAIKKRIEALRSKP